jgi:hypothetical protein
MIVVATRAEAQARRRAYTSPHGARATVDTYFGVNRSMRDDLAADPDGLAPNAYLVMQDPGAVLQPHFHEADQFQVVVRGCGRIGTHAVGALTVHYAAAHSPYGPVVAGPEGLHYLTLRHRADPGAQWMPEAAPRLRGMAGRRHVVLTSSIVPVGAASADARGEPATPLLADGDAGAWTVALGAGASWRLDVCGGCFVHATSGDLQVSGIGMGPQACLFAGGDERAIVLSAGPGGARAVVVRFGGR